MELLNTIILSIVEGITEFLPISSTGHLILTSQLLKIPQTEFLKTFEIAIQLGAICAVVFLYWKRFLSNWNLNFKILTAFVPTALVGFFLYPFIKSFLLSSSAVTLVTLFLGGVFLIFFEKYLIKNSNKKLSDLTFKNSFLIGIFQSISVIPGVSRAAATIVGGNLIGLDRVSATEFSFLLAVPTMMAATGLDLIKTAGNFSGSEYTNLGIGFVLSFVVAIFAIKFLIKYVSKNNFVGFGFYRIILSILYFLFVLK